jgi:hypothetical protein
VTFVDFLAAEKRILVSINNLGIAIASWWAMGCCDWGAHVY